MYAIALALALGAAPASPTDALPDPLTLDALQQAARQANPALRASSQRALSVKQRGDAEGSLPSPELSADIWRLPLNQPWNLYESSMVMVTFRQRLPAWGVRGAKQEALEAEASGEGARREALALELDRQVSAAFVAFREAHARHAVHEKHLDVLGRVVAMAQGRISSGGRLDEVSQATREKARLEADVAVERAGVTRAAVRLNALLGRPLDAALGTPTPWADETVTASMDELVAAARTARPEPKFAASQERKQEASARAAKQEALAPGVSLGLSWFPPVSMAPTHGLGVSVAVELPWLWGGRFAMKDGEATMAGAQREESADVNYRLAVEVATALATVREATVRVKALEQTALPAARRAVDTALSAYGAGQQDVQTLLAAEQAVVELDVAVVEARATLDLALAELDWAVGGKAPRAAMAP
jgi:outer membrane protein TolC